MSKPVCKNAGEARSQLPALLADAARGRATIITRYGRPVAAIVPARDAERGPRQQPLSRLAGSGKALWGRESRRSLRRLRDEWSR
ncbi:MAG: type II toxin-antitoxin system Phd/YefM family antitoxin [Burkholderiales bacterium]|nr:type II toxin-antitoxin system Phd/YefM family antitoxin [Burkholderiales bacterium]